MKIKSILLATALLMISLATFAQKKPSSSGSGKAPAKNESTKDKDKKEEDKKEQVKDEKPADKDVKPAGKEEVAGDQNETNLVSNPSFEDYDGKLLKGRNQLSVACNGWTAPNKTSADLFVTNHKSKKINVPDNEVGFQTALDGINYAGFMAYSKDPKVGRTYLMSKLKRRLVKNQLYCVRYSISLSDYSKFAVNNVGVLLSEKKYQNETDGPIAVTPTVVQTANRVVSESGEWVTICSSYIAKGNEEYIIIGGFGADGEMKFEKTKAPAKPAAGGLPVNGAYYYVDNLEVSPIQAKSQCFCGKASDKEPDLIYSSSKAKDPAAKPEALVAATAIYFSRESAEIPAQFEEELNDVAKILVANPGIKITLTGHADAEEMTEAKVNPKLLDVAQRRAQSVKEALVGQGVNESRIQVASKDANEPASTKLTPLSKAQNRRVIFSLQ
jgi:outer membrane protein OmpA-like peptidoglycan-associated protein